MKKVSFQDFLQRCSELKLATSITRTASYNKFEIKDKDLHFNRVNTETKWKIDLRQLYDVYQTLDLITPTLLRKEMTGRIYSPAWAILVECGLYNSYGRRV